MPDALDSPIRGSAIVLLGSFNPPIFQPAWFSHYGIIEDELAAGAEDVHIDTDYCYWLTREFGCEVTRDRLRIFSTPLTQRRDLLRDAAAGAFTLLYHTPVGGVSMISFRHVEPSTLVWEDFGPRLCAGGAWSDVMEGAALERLVIRQDLDDEYSGVRSLAVEPSRRLPEGVYLSVTHQYRLPDEASEDAAIARQLLEENWDRAVDAGDELMEMLIS